MGIAKKTDGRYVVGLGVTDANDYKGSASYRDIYIQLTADGATEESVEYLTYLKDYAVYANAQGEPIMPPSVNVWISNNGVTTAVEADDLSLDGDDFTICGIVYSGGTWDYSNAGSGHGGGSSLPSYTDADKGKVLGLAEDGEAVAPAWVNGGGGGLPEVTSADEGKVLAVNASGKWAAESPVLKLEFDNLDPDKLLCSYNQLKESLEKGKVVYYIQQFDDDSTIYTYRAELSIVFGPTNDAYKAQFIATYFDDGTVNEVFQYTADSADQPYMMID